MNSEIDNLKHQVGPEKKEQSYQSWSERKKSKKNAPDEHKEKHSEAEKNSLIRHANARVGTQNVMDEISVASE